MTDTGHHDERIAAMTFASVWPMYVAKVEKKGRTADELRQVVAWLTGYDGAAIDRQIAEKSTFAQFFAGATIHPNAPLVTGTICGYRIQEIANPLTRNVRILDKLVDELAKGRPLAKILRAG
jgi:hypothetical protein